MVQAGPGMWPGMRGKVRGFLLLAHPVPTAMFVVALGALSCVAALSAHHELDALRLVLLVAGAACAYIAIGAANDYCDRELDAPSRTDKPIVQGLVTPGHAVVLAGAATAGLLVLLTPLGVLAVLLALLIEALGMSYNLGLKRTPVSGLVVAASFPLLPLLAWDVFGRWQEFLLWLFVIALGLGVEMNVANTLPDLEEDRAHGAQSLAQVLGRRGALALAWSIPVAVVTLMWALDLSATVPAHLPTIAVATVIGLGSTAVAITLVVRRQLQSTLRRAFIVQAGGAVVLVTVWLVAVAF